MPSREPILDALVLAAGAGSRFGGGKLLAHFEGGTVLGSAIRAALAAPVRRVTVVVGHEAETVAAEARRADASDKLAIVEAADWAEGMSASFRVGLASLPEDSQGLFVFLGDMPRIPPGILPGLAQRLQGGALAALPVHQGRRGHPVLIARALYPELALLSGDQGARRVLDQLGDRLGLVETDDPGVLQDVDTPEDLAALQGL